MKTHTKWMSTHRELVAKFIKLLNTYARGYSVVAPLGDSGLYLSPAQIQTIEYVLEGEGQKMTEIASKIGIARATLSNTVKTLEQKGYLRKFYKKENRKDIYLEVTEQGEALYQAYSEYIYDLWFKQIFNLVESMALEDVETMGKIVESFTEMFIYQRIESGSIQSTEDRL